MVLVFAFFHVLAGLSPANAAVYPKIEASFNLIGLATDPFDYTVTDVQVRITQPDSSVVSLPAFFDGGTTWRVRHTPQMAGLYSVIGVTLNGSPAAASNLQPTAWTVAGPAIGPGYVMVDPGNARRFITSDGKRFFPRGENVAWDQGGHNVTNVLLKMGAAHENWARVWMSAFATPGNLDWPKVSNTFGTLSLTIATNWDMVVSSAEQAGVRFQMTLHHHGEYSTTVNPNWPQNPYNTANGGFLSNPVQFFTNSMAKDLTKRKLRYAVARWGYSTSVMAWELFNEVQFTDAGQTGQWGIVQSWHDEMATFLRSQDPYHHLITTSSLLNEPLWDKTDYYQHHDYPSDLIAGIRDAADITGTQTVAPDYSGECGTNGTLHLGVNAPQWAGLMAGQSGNAQLWYWDTMDAANDYTNFRAVSDFVTMSGLGDQDSVAKSSPQIATVGVIGPLVFAPGGGFVKATQDTFTVAAATPDGFGATPNYLQGNGNRSLTPNGYTFLVNYPQNGTFSVQIIQIAKAGATFQLFLDSVLRTNVVFPSNTSDTSTNFTATITVTSGAHTILLYNSGADWVNLGNITLNPYAPLLGAYAVGNSAFNATWIWNRTNVFNTSASTPTSGTVNVAGLNPGTYSATWWDTFAGVAISNLTVSIADTNPVTLNTPSILRSAALYVGLPAQVGITPPSLTQTVITNSPPFSVPLIITNGGGLPLGYSLSVTGASPVMYSAINSTQTGGPIFAWKDISGVGQDISSSFTALAGPKTAKDEGIAGPINIGFAFPFFSGAQTPATFTQLYISPNGFVTFSPFAGDTSTNTVLPSSSAPSNCIAFFWDDLDINTSGHVYTSTDPISGTFTIQFQNVRFKGTSSTVSCQLILKTTGEIVMQYQSLAVSNACTVGVQDALRDQGLTVAFNQNYLQPNFAVQLTPVPWLAFSSSAGFVSRTGSEQVDITFNPTGLAAGTYNATLLVNTTDPLLPVTTLPVSFTISTGAPAAPSGLVVNSVTWSQVTLSWKDNSTNESGFQMERSISGPGGPYSPVATVGANVTNFIDTNLASQTSYYYRVVGTNASGFSAYSTPVLATTAMAPIDIWRLANFGTSSNSGIAADTADPDNDRLINILEYAFDSDPNTPSPNPFSFAMVGGHLTVAFKRTHPAPADITYIVEVSGDLTSGIWDSSPGAVSQSVQDNGDGTETVTLTDAASTDTAPTHYLRVRIVRL